MTEDEINLAVVAAQAAANRMVESVPIGTKVHTVMVAALLLAVYSGKKLELNKLDVQKTFMNIWDKSTDPNAKEAN